MEIQADNKVRVVALSNLEAMCKRHSGTSHGYWVEKVTKNRVHVGYSNPDEWGPRNPMFAVYPCYPAAFGDSVMVVLDIVRVVNDYDDEDGWQNFDFLTDCEVLWRNPTSLEWNTREEIEGTIEVEVCDD